MGPRPDPGPQGVDGDGDDGGGGRISWPPENEATGSRKISKCLPGLKHIITHIKNRIKRPEI